MEIAVVGLSHTGEVYSACLSELGHTVTGIDLNKNIVSKLNEGISPSREPGMEIILQHNLKRRTLSYTTDFNQIKKRGVVWLTLDTKLDSNARGNTKKIFRYIEKITPLLRNNSLLIVTSQLPVGSSSEITKMIKTKRSKLQFDYAYVPENLRLGQAVESFMSPSRIVVGVENQKRVADIKKLFKNMSKDIIIVKTASAEMIKHATNAYLASSISFIHDISDICEKVDADITEVSLALRADVRIGPKAYVDANLGFSGGHLERDLQYLKKIARLNHLSVPVINSVVKKNTARRNKVFEKLSYYLPGCKNKTIAFWGITYKSGTPTIRHSLALHLIKRALQNKMKIRLSDPLVGEKEIGGEIPTTSFHFTNNLYESATGCSAVVCIIPWEKLKDIDFKRLSSHMVEPKIFFDSENYLKLKQFEIKQAGMKYIGIGR